MFIKEKRKIKSLSWLVLVAVIAVLCGGCGLAEKHKIQKAKTRVRTILKGISSESLGSGLDEQTSACLWWREVPIIPDLGELGEASQAFDTFRIEGNIFDPIDEFEITGARLLEGVEPVTVIISGYIDNFPFTWRVPKGQTITWE